MFRSSLAFLALSAVLPLVPAAPALADGDPLTSQFTYQGRLESAGEPVDGDIDFAFILRDVSPPYPWGQIVAGPIVLNDVPVADGLFTVSLDFGVDVFNGEARQLEIHAEGQQLLPFQPITGTPYALQTRGLFVDADLNVGVGTEDPQADLHVQGSTSSAGLRVATASQSGPWYDFLVQQSSGGMMLQNHAVGDVMNFASSGDIWIRENLMVEGSAVVGNDDAAQNPHGFSSVLNVQAPSGGPHNAALVLSDTQGRAWSIGLTTGGALDLFKAGSGSNHVILPVLQIRGGADIAEPFDIADDAALEPGMLVAIDPDRPGTLRLATNAYDRTVAGIVSGAGGVKPGLTLTQEDSIADGTHPVALTGRVYCYVDADANGPIAPGDLLTTSDTPGHAMRATDRDRTPGAVIGKAMTSLESGRGLVLVLVSLQ